MNYVLQLHGERIVYPVPPGLPELMSDISREVLRDQPPQIYRYIANLLETMLKVRHYSRVAGQLVDDVIGENSELLAYVQSLGLTPQEANRSARIIQGAFRTLICKKDLRRKIEAKKEKDHLKHLLDSSSSFKEYLLTSRNLNIESSSTSSSQLVDQYKDFKAQQEKVKEVSHKHASTHTIETFQPRMASIPKSRDSKRLTYLESNPSLESAWFNRSTYEENDSVTELIYKQEPQQVESYLKSRISTTTRKVRSESTISTVMEDEMGLPSYYNKSKILIPMISKSGELTQRNVKETDTLYSLSNQEAHDQVSLRDVRLSSIINEFASQDKQEVAMDTLQDIEMRINSATILPEQEDVTAEEKEVDVSTNRLSKAKSSTRSVAKTSRRSSDHQPKSSSTEVSQS